MSFNPCCLNLGSTPPRPGRLAPEDQRAGPRQGVGKVVQELLRVLGVAVVDELVGAGERGGERIGSSLHAHLGRQRLPRALLLVLAEADRPPSRNALRG